MSDTKRYHGSTFTETRTTTDVRRQAFGRAYSTIARVWEVSGRIRKGAAVRPFLTSIRECRDYVDAEDALREPLSEEAAREMDASLGRRSE